MENKALGKGLSALISQAREKAMQDTAAIEQMRAQAHEKEGIQATVTVSMVKTELIDNNPIQPRAVYDEASLGELKASIKEKGIIQPIMIRPRGNRFEVVAGERRLRAARALELEVVPAVIRDVSDVECLLLAVVENIQRQDLNAMDQALAFQILIEDYKLTQEQVAKSVGKDRSTIANTLRLLNLPSDIQMYIREGALSMGHARALLAVQDIGKQLKMAKDIVHQNLSVRSVEGLAQQSSGKIPKKTKAHKAKDPDIAILEDELRKILGTKVLVEDKKGKGKLIVEYYSLNDLDRILEILRKNNPSA